MYARSYRELIVWQRAMELIRETDEICAELPASERFELARQIRRAAGSIPANIAEGFAGRRPSDLARYLTIARGSLLELETHLSIAESRGYCDSARLSRFGDLADQVGRMLTAQRKSVLRRAH